ncbi:unnamed protein product [Allacma fusca]|uniref:Uncharacterized protein n=1 Tax=Allacma fusca TaxID=39272 RepID=A0A8J2K1I1_9HEXA|nr:unnamed protein product [Allacma fusca]
MHYLLKGLPPSLAHTIRAQLSNGSSVENFLERITFHCSDPNFHLFASNPVLPKQVESITNSELYNPNHADPPHNPNTCQYCGKYDHSLLKCFKLQDHFSANNPADKPNARSRPTTGPSQP